MKTFKYLFSILLFPCFIFAQQVPDTAFNYKIDQPRYATGAGPVICIDAAHYNFHTADNRFYAFAKLLRADGYVISDNDDQFDAQSLAKCYMLVISNAIHEQNQNGNWALPNPSAFTPEEIRAIKTWVETGGRLFLIADHMPFAGAAAELARTFGFEFLNSFAMDNRRRNIEYFSRSNGTLREHPVTIGVDSVVTFTGSAFKIPRKAQPILTLDKNYTVLMPEVAWQFNDNTPHVSGAKLCQMASLEYGEGKVLVSGEAAMFSAQLAGPNQTQMGMNAPFAKNNPKLLLNIIHWLDAQ